MSARAPQRDKKNRAEIPRPAPGSPNSQLGNTGKFPAAPNFPAACCSNNLMLYCLIGHKYKHTIHWYIRRVYRGASRGIPAPPFYPDRAQNEPNHPPRKSPFPGPKGRGSSPPSKPILSVEGGINGGSAQRTPSEAFPRSLPSPEVVGGKGSDQRKGGLRS
jgi:hypothetical protein